MGPVGWSLLSLVPIFWAASLAKATRTRAESPFKVGPGDPAGEGTVAVLIPARDEAANIVACVRAARAALGPGPAIFALDDGSTDGTGALLTEVQQEDPDLHVIVGGGEPLPAGWFGKPWACQRLAAAARSHDPGLDWLLFIDADVRLAPRSVGAVVGYAERNALDLLSGFGQLELRSFWEKVLQPAVAGLILGAHDFAKTNAPAKPDAELIANGQLILARASAYFDAGGHQLVANNVLDDVGMAQAFVARGLRYHIAYMTTVFSCRMYTSMAEIWAGWNKNLFAGFGRSWLKVIIVVMGIFWVVLAPWLALALSLTGSLPLGVGVWGALTVALQLALRFYLDGVFSQDRRYSITMPLGWALLSLLILSSAFSTSLGRTEWKGRSLKVGG